MDSQELQAVFQILACPKMHQQLPTPSLPLQTVQHAPTGVAEAAEAAVASTSVGVEEMIVEEEDATPFTHPPIRFDSIFYIFRAVCRSRAVKISTPFFFMNTDPPKHRGSP